MQNPLPRILIFASLALLALAGCSAGPSEIVSGSPGSSPSNPSSPRSTASSSAQTTLVALTTNNTAACPASGTLPPYCQKAFTGQTDSRPLVATPNFDLAAGNVSTEDPHGYLTLGAQTKIYANFMLGFCTNSSSAYCNNQVQPGYTSKDANTIAAQATDLRNRHFDGAAVTWQGAGTAEDAATLLFQQWADENSCSGSDCSLGYLIMYDGASMAYNVTSTGISGTSGQSCSGSSGAAYENCIVAHMRNDMCYMNGMHWGNAAYLKKNGRPVLQIFPQEGVIPATGPAPSWDDAWAQIETWNNDLPGNCAMAPYNTDNGIPLIVFENNGGFTHQDSSGSYYWVEPAGTDPATDQVVDNISPQATAGTLDNFFTTAQLYTDQLGWSGAFKGFNSSQSTWGPDRIMDQQCGQTWIESLTESNSYYRTSALPYLEVATWNDYNEGTEIETGIDNCYAVSAGVSGATLNWALDTTKSAASLSTVSHIDIYDSADGQTLKLLTTQPAAQDGTWDLSALPSGTHILFVRMVGKNSILNQISAGIAYAN